MTLNLALSSFLPTENDLNKKGYFRYMGSLTTPPCTEQIIWTLFRKHISISSSQVI